MSEPIADGTWSTDVTKLKPLGPLTMKHITEATDRLKRPDICDCSFCQSPSR